MGNINHRILRCMNSVGITRLIRNCSSNIPRIVMYHGVIDDKSKLKCWWQIKESNFIKQIQYIHKNYNVISIDELNERLLKKKAPQRRTCVLTFDDGYQSFITMVLPILKYYQMPATVYITSAFTQKNEMIWTDKLFWRLYNTSRLALDISEMGLGKWDLKSEDKTISSAHDIINQLKLIDAEEKNKLLEKIYEKLGVCKIKERYHNHHPFKLLSVEQVKELSTCPLVTIGSHSLSHEVLPKLNRVELEREIRESKILIESWINKPVLHFSYPDGKFTHEIASVVQRYGYQTAVRIGLGKLDGSKPFELNRLGTGSWDDFADFKAMIDGLTTAKIELKKFIKKMISYN